MSTFTLATIIACVTIVVLTVVILWIRQAARPKPVIIIRHPRPRADMYAKAAETIVTPVGRISFPNGLGKTRVVGKSPELGYGYNAKGRRFPERRRDEDDTLGVMVHPNLGLGFGMDESPITKHEDRPAQHHVERGGDIGTREHEGFKTGGWFGGDTDFHTGGGFGGSSDHSSSSSDSSSSSSYDSGSSSSDSGGGGSD